MLWYVDMIIPNIFFVLFLTISLFHQDVAGAAVSALKSDAGILDTHDKIVQAARL